MKTLSKFLCPATEFLDARKAPKSVDKSDEDCDYIVAVDIDLWRGVCDP